MKMSKVADTGSFVLMFLKCFLEQQCLLIVHYSVLLNAFPSGILCKQINVVQSVAYFKNA